jgi:hypothetical protein
MYLKTILQMCRDEITVARFRNNKIILTGEKKRMSIFRIAVVKAAPGEVKMDFPSAKVEDP